jgi:RNA polymerase sporulation-specific sigma factor
MHFRAGKKRSAEISMNETIDVDRDGNPLTYTDVISSEEDLPEDVMRSVEADRALTLVRTRLEPRERQIITLRFGLGGAPALTQREIADQLGISRSYVSRIEKAALDKLKEGFGIKG